MFARGLRFILPVLGVFLAVSPAFGNVAPEFLQPGASETLRVGGTVRDVDLRALFRDPDVTGSVVRMSVRIGTTTQTVDIALYDQEKPITVANFLRYVTDGRYAGSFVHRAVPGFVVQGGGFFWNATNQIAAVPTYAAIQNEPGISNLRGTIAMAKIGGDPNSATGQWFINLADNSANLNAQNGGFTVFGRVVGNGMTVIDEVAALPIYNAGSPLDNIPLKDVFGNQLLRAFTVETDAAVIPSLSFGAVSGDPGLIAVSVSGSTLRLTPDPTRSGTTTVTLSATDLDGAVTEAILAVNVLSKSAGWLVENAPDAQPGVFAFDPADEAGLSGDAVAVSLGTLAPGYGVSRIFTIRNDGSTSLTGLTVSVQGGGAFEVTDGPGATDLGSGEATTFAVVFSPRARGGHDATLHVAAGGENGASFTVALSGTGGEVIPPQISGVSPRTLFAGVSGTVEVPDWRGAEVTATDNLGVESFTQSPEPGTTVPVGSYPVIFSATNTLGAVTVVESTLTVQYERASALRLETSGGYVGAPVPEIGGEGILPGSFLSTVGAPAVSDRRHLAACVGIQSGNARMEAVFVEDGTGERRLAARQGGPAGIIGASFKRFHDPLLSPGGKIAFCAQLTGLARTADDGVWTDLFGEIEPVLREGGPTPGLGGLKLKSVMSLSISDEALLALVKLAPQKGVVVPGVSDTALVRITGADSGTVLARTGAVFFGSTVRRISVLRPAARSEGQGRWHNAAATLVKFSLRDKRTVLVRIDNDGTQTPLLQAGADDPAFPARLSALGVPVLGGPGVAVLATKARAIDTTKANDSVLLFAPDGVTFAEVAAENVTTDALGAPRFSGFSDPVANDRGTVLFFATLRDGIGPGANNAALWQTDGAGAPGIVARIGSPATDADGDPIADTAWASFTSFALPDGPGAGAIFVATIEGKAVTRQNKLGLWAVDSAGLVRLLLRTGGTVTLPDGTKTVSSFTVLNAAHGSFGARRSYNAAGSVAVQVQFADRTQAIVRLEVP